MEQRRTVDLVDYHERIAAGFFQIGGKQQRKQTK